MRDLWTPSDSIADGLKQAQEEGDFSEVAFIFNILKRRAKILQDAITVIQCGIVRPAEGNMGEIAMEYVKNEQLLDLTDKITTAMFAGIQQSQDPLQVN